MLRNLPGPRDSGWAYVGIAGLAIVLAFIGSGLHSHFYAKNVLCTANGKGNTFSCGADNALWQFGSFIHWVAIIALLVMAIGVVVAVLVLRQGRDGA